MIHFFSINLRLPYVYSEIERETEPAELMLYLICTRYQTDFNIFFLF